MTTTDKNKLKRALWMAFEASTPMGMGFLHAEAALKQTEDSLFEANYQEGEGINTDYVFGRMMKTRFSMSDGILTISPETPRLDYQSWASEYPTGSALVKAVEESLAVEKV